MNNSNHNINSSIHNNINNNNLNVNNTTVRSSSPTPSLSGGNNNNKVHDTLPPLPPTGAQPVPVPMPLKETTKFADPEILYHFPEDADPPPSQVLNYFFIIIFVNKIDNILLDLWILSSKWCKNKTSCW